jgi:hypothetical protein
MTAGDLLLVRGGKSIEDRIIMLGTHSVYSHVAIIMDASGLLLAEATRTGIAFAHIDKYARAETHVIDVGMTDAERVDACRFASSCIGQHYGTAQIVAITACWLSGKRWYFGMENTEDCASYCARALEHGGALLGKAPELYRPRDFADLFNVVPRLGKP